jgi:hypothetical protein
MTSWWQKVSLSTFASNAPQRLKRYGESKAHEKAKEKVAHVLREAGWTTYVDCYSFGCQTDRGTRTYWPDIYAERGDIQTGGRRIIVEVQGFKGHQSKAAFAADRLRIQDIHSSHGTDIEFFEVHLNRRIGPLDIRSWTVEDICEHLNLS